MTGVPRGHDDEIEALIVDRYLESLLARRPQSVADLPADLADAADRLVRSLPRFHPSFRFEEALAARLAAAAAGARDPDGRLVPFAPSREGRSGGGRPPRSRPVVLGSVVTSAAAISLAGAAYVAWRLARPGDPMTRAVRAVARARIA